MLNYFTNVARFKTYKKFLKVYVTSKLDDNFGVFLTD